MMSENKIEAINSQATQHRPKRDLELLVHGRFQLLLVSAEELFGHLEREEQGMESDVGIYVYVCVF